MNDEPQSDSATDWDRFCIYCQRELASVASLHRHLRRMHPGTYAAQTIAGESADG